MNFALLWMASSITTPSTLSTSGWATSFLFFCRSLNLFWINKAFSFCSLRISCSSFGLLIITFGRGLNTSEMILCCVSILGCFFRPLAVFCPCSVESNIQLFTFFVISKLLLNLFCSVHFLYHRRFLIFFFLLFTLLKHDSVFSLNEGCFVVLFLLFFTFL